MLESPLLSILPSSMRREELPSEINTRENLLSPLISESRRPEPSEDNSLKSKLPLSSPRPKRSSTTSDSESSPSRLDFCRLFIQNCFYIVWKCSVACKTILFKIQNLFFLSYFLSILFHKTIATYFFYQINIIASLAVKGNFNTKHQISKRVNFIL